MGLPPTGPSNVAMTEIRPMTGIRTTGTFPDALLPPAGILRTRTRMAQDATKGGMPGMG
jgi:hypothetical protein